MVDNKELDEEELEDLNLEKEYDEMSKQGMGAPKLDVRQEVSMSPEQIEILAKNMSERDAPLEDVFGTEEATAKALIELVRTERINLLTELNYEEIQMLIVGETVGSFLFQHTGSDTLLSMCNLFKEMKVSINRKGRTEIVGLGTFLGGFGDDKKAKQGLLGLR